MGSIHTGLTPFGSDEKRGSGFGHAPAGEYAPWPKVDPTGAVLPSRPFGATR